ncbi:MAG: hypothetical protein P4M11_15105 [Candidatus Pacebacteria bacterium]|nr:hypothetical protein [Candidatus Paceibacterota bacterium]
MDSPLAAKEGRRRTRSLCVTESNCYEGDGTSSSGTTESSTSNPFGPAVSDQSPPMPATITTTAAPTEGPSQFLLIPGSLSPPTVLSSTEPEGKTKETGKLFDDFNARMEARKKQVLEMRAKNCDVHPIRHPSAIHLESRQRQLRSKFYMEVTEDEQKCDAGVPEEAIHVAASC